MTTILVTGATGQVGRSLVPRLLQWTKAEQGETVRLLVRDEERARRLEKEGAEVVLGDLRDEAARAEALRGADVVLNVAAAFRGVPEEEVWAVNHAAAVALGREAAAAGVARFVHTSTNLVYPSGLGRPAREEDELSADAAWGAYPASKIASERDLRGVDGLPLVVLRLAFVYGEGDSHLRDILPRTADWPAHQRLATVHVADVCTALLRALRAPGIEGGTFNIGDDAGITAWDVHAFAGVPFPQSPRRQDMDPWDKVPSTDRARRVLGWRPQFPTVLAARDAGAL